MRRMIYRQPAALMALLLTTRIIYDVTAVARGVRAEGSVWESSGRETMLTSNLLSRALDQWAREGGGFTVEDAQLAAEVEAAAAAALGGLVPDEHSRDLERYRNKGCHMMKAGCVSFFLELMRNISSLGVNLSLPPTSEEALGDTCPGGQCGSCAVVGNAWHLLGSRLGPSIDAHDIVIRFAGAIEHAGFAEDVGTTSDFRVVYHSTAPKVPAHPNEKILHLVTRIPEDVRSFWRLAAEWPTQLNKACPSSEPQEGPGAHKGRGACRRIGPSVILVSPWLVQDIREEMDANEIEQPWPSAGLVALAWARRHCSTVDTYGFGGGQPDGAWHYWEAPEAHSRSKDHVWGAEEEVREMLGDAGFLREHFPQKLSSSSVGAVWGPEYHRLVAADRLKPRSQQRIHPPSSWSVSSDLQALVVWPPRGWCIAQGTPLEVRVILPPLSHTTCRTQVCGNPRREGQHWVVRVMPVGGDGHSQRCGEGAVLQHRIGDEAQVVVQADTSRMHFGEYQVQVVLQVQEEGTAGEGCPLASGVSVGNAVRLVITSDPSACRRRPHAGSSGNIEAGDGGLSKRVQESLLRAQRPHSCKHKPLLLVHCPLPANAQAPSSFAHVLGQPWAASGATGTLAALISLAYNLNLTLVLVNGHEFDAVARGRGEGHPVEGARPGSEPEAYARHRWIEGVLGSWRVGSRCSHLDAQGFLSLGALPGDMAAELADVARRVPQEFASADIDETGLAIWQHELEHFVQSHSVHVGWF